VIYVLHVMFVACHCLLNIMVMVRSLEEYYVRGYNAVQSVGKSDDVSEEHRLQLGSNNQQDNDVKAGCSRSVGLFGDIH
jgi:hypothetical protein